MPEDFENAINVDQMTDDDIRGLVRQQLDEADKFNVDTVEVSVEEGRVSVAGRVGTEAERQHVEQVLSRLGISDYDNDVVVDELARAQRAEGADTARIEDAAATASIGESGKATTDTAEHLQPDDAGDMYGTKDRKKAIEEGETYTPPDSPVQEGVRGDETH